MADINVTLTEPPIIAVTVTKPADILVEFPAQQGPSGAIALDAHVAEANPHQQYKLNDLSKTFAYNPDGSLLSVTDAYGSKTFTYNPDGTLAAVAGTGSYQSKALDYSDGKLIAVTVS
jgi:YD repeat-containing protein